MKQKNYEPLSVEINYFNNADVVTTSDPFKEDLYGDDVWM